MKQIELEVLNVLLETAKFQAENADYPEAEAVWAKEVANLKKRIAKCHAKAGA